MKNYFQSTMLLLMLAGFVGCQPTADSDSEAPLTDANAPLHLMQPEYNVPYVVPEKAEIVEVLDRVHGYLEATTPTALVDKDSGEEVTDYDAIDGETVFKAGDFRLTSYEWGVTYAGMLNAAAVTGNDKFANYTYDRLAFLADIRPYFLNLDEESGSRYAMHSVLHPGALDDSGALCAAMIKAKLAGQSADLDPMIDNFMNYISHEEFRLEDGTLARNRPMRNSLWLDDLFMSVPAMAGWVSTPAKQPIGMMPSSRCCNLPIVCSMRRSSCLCMVGFWTWKNTRNFTGHVPMVGP